MDDLKRSLSPSTGSLVTSYTKRPRRDAPLMDSLDDLDNRVLKDANRLGLQESEQSLALWLTLSPPILRHWTIAIKFPRDIY